MYGDQHRMNTITITMVILTVFTLARGMRPRELARRLECSSLLLLPPRPLLRRSEGDKECPRGEGAQWVEETVNQRTQWAIKERIEGMETPILLLLHFPRPLQPLSPSRKGGDKES